MTIRSWRASHHARIHMLEKHNVEWQEVDEVMSASYQLRRASKIRGQQRYYVRGRTYAGRRLTVIVAFEGDCLRVITAYDSGRRLR